MEVHASSGQMKSKIDATFKLASACDFIWPDLENGFIFFRYYAVLRRRNYVTPTSYLELIKTFKSLLGKKRFQILTLKTRYLKGLEKLDFASSQVNKICQIHGTQRVEFSLVFLPL